ncbi:NAD(P)-binding protein [Aulographum hederae CBS 113979]|uniref:NADP-dependent mannitol dehydrogenase n=1 Tax=Aulographum hederae CBS 113979 TaxID=1176131 RepID=A0A6G1GKU3_9PEZI|nr:NAD(P)-binding protein [Aulographum hederae CBS 113979]
MRNFALSGKVAIVTGGGRGLGYNIAQALAEAGARGLAIFDMQDELGEEAARGLCNDTGLDVQFYKVDVRDGKTINDSVANVIEHFGRIDVLVNAAGIADSNLHAETYEVSRFRNQIDINLTGTFLTAQAVARHMIATPVAAASPSCSRHRGSLIFIASMSGSIVNYPQPQSGYNASKAGVIQLAKSFAAEWAAYGIRVNTISPGYMDTSLNRVPALDAQKRIWVERTPQARLGGVDELNCLAVYLASEGSGFMTGSNLVIDGGYTCW